jgi:hypothetical protein
VVSVEFSYTDLENSINQTDSSIDRQHYTTPTTQNASELRQRRSSVTTPQSSQDPQRHTDFIILKVEKSNDLRVRDLIYLT